jgi:hypothetical protein
VEEEEERISRGIDELLGLIFLGIFFSLGRVIIF